MMSGTTTILISICVLCLQTVHGQVSLSIRLDKYVNPGGKGANGVCCDGFKVLGKQFCNDDSRCDHYFQICLDYPESQSQDMNICPLGTYTTGVIEEDTIVFTDMIGATRNPFVSEISRDSWHNGTKIKVNVWDYDSRNSNDFVEYLESTYFFQPDGVNHPLTLHTRTSLNLHISASCPDEWMGSRCDIFCRDSQYHQCDKATGEKMCKARCNSTETSEIVYLINPKGLTVPEFRKLLDFFSGISGNLMLAGSKTRVSIIQFWSEQNVTTTKVEFPLRFWNSTGQLRNATHNVAQMRGMNAGRMSNGSVSKALADVLNYTRIRADAPRIIITADFENNAQGNLAESALQIQAQRGAGVIAVGFNRANLELSKFVSSSRMFHVPVLAQLPAMVNSFMDTLCSTVQEQKNVAVPYNPYSVPNKLPTPSPKVNEHQQNSSTAGSFYGNKCFECSTINMSRLDTGVQQQFEALTGRPIAQTPAHVDCMDLSISTDPARYAVNCEGVCITGFWELSVSFAYRTCISATYECADLSHEEDDGSTFHCCEDNLCNTHTQTGGHGVTALAPDVWTRFSTGCACRYADQSDNSCACCEEGGCQSSSYANKNLCTSCSGQSGNTESGIGECVTSCDGVSDGDHQSCLGCNIYATCTHGRLFTRRCTANLVWNDAIKNCDYTSEYCESTSVTRRQANRRSLENNVDGFTRSMSGCPCAFDHSRTDCACCQGDQSCPCGADNRNQCVLCGHPEHCGRKKALFGW